MRRTGIADMPLHYGKMPSWLFGRMVQLARQITMAIVTEYGSEEMVKRLSDPYWFHAFGCALGFDWNSSGLTTTVCGALKEGLRGLEQDLGIFVAGGKGGTSRKTPQEIERFATKFPIATPATSLIYSSRMSAKVDNTALQDGYQLYHHNFIFTRSGLWTVIQQGMNPESRWARRYHWLSSEVKDFVCEPEKAICCDHKGKVLNLVAKESDEARTTSASLSRENPAKLIAEIKDLPTLKLPREHQLFFQSLKPSYLSRVLLSTYEQQPENFERLLGIKGVGPKTIRALSLLSELIYGVKVSRRDPVKYSFAHGGKDGYPYMLDRTTYDRSIEILKKAITDAKLGRSEKIEALKRLGKGRKK